MLIEKFHFVISLGGRHTFLYTFEETAVSYDEKTPNPKEKELVFSDKRNIWLMCLLQRFAVFISSAEVVVYLEM